MNEALTFLSFRYLFNGMFYLHCLNVIIRARNYCYYYNEPRTSYYSNKKNIIKL